MEKPIIKDKSVQEYVDYLESRLRVFDESPYIKSYLTLNKVVEAINKKIEDTPIDQILENSNLKKDLVSQKNYLEQMDDFKKKMSPVDRKSLEKKMEENAGIAERMALRVKNGADRTL